MGACYIGIVRRFGVACIEGRSLPKCDALNLGLNVSVPGIILAKCPSIQGFASSLLGMQLPATLAVTFYKA